MQQPNFSDCCIVLRPPLCRYGLPFVLPLRCRQGAPQSPRKVPALFPQTSRKMPAFPVSRCAAGVSRAAGAVGASGAAVPALYHRRLRISPGRGVFPADNERKGGWL